jgi:acyl dehydratase
LANINPPGFIVERGKVHEFANAILDDNPHYHDLEAATRDGLPSVVAPLTYSSVASYFTDRAAPGGAMSGLDMRYVLHGGQEWIFERPIFAGDVLTAEAGGSSSYEKEGKRGGMMKFIESETVYRDQSGEIVLRAKSTLIQTSGVVRS